MGQSCWAASTNMINRAYMGAPLIGEPLSKAMKFAHVSNTDFGIGLIGFTSSLPSYIRLKTNG